MKNAIARFQSSIVLMAALALAACAGDDISSPNSSLTPEFNSTPTIGVLLAKRGPAGTTATFAISATGGNLPAGATVTLNSCPLDTTVPCETALVWTPSNNDVVNVTITEIATTGNIVFSELGVSRTMNGVLTGWLISAPAPPTTTFEMNGTADALVRFKNVEGPPQTPALRVVKTAGSETVAVGSAMSFSMTVFSDGPGTATGVTLTDPLPGGLGINWSTASAGCSISGSAPTQTLNCSFGDLAAGQSRTAVVTSNTTFNVTSCGNYPNTVTVNATNHASIQASADIDVTGCLTQGETATGQGFPWAATQDAPNNWFMYTPWNNTGGHTGIVNGANLIAGQHYLAGRITGTRGTTTSITITLNAGWAFFNAASNVKILPMTSCTAAQPYVSPGKFTVKRSVSSSANSITVTGLPNTACYGIHVDVVSVE